MPRYVIERQYLVPLFEHIFVEAPDLETACRKALDDTVCPWGDDTVLNFDNCGPTTIAQAVEIPEDLFQEMQSAEDRDLHVLSQVLYDSGIELLSIPPAFREADPSDGDPVGFF